MNITDLLNSGKLHAAARANRPDCVDSAGNIHKSAERAEYVNWRASMKAIHGDDAKQWPASVKAELKRRHVPA